MSPFENSLYRKPQAAAPNGDGAEKPSGLSVQSVSPQDAKIVNPGLYFNKV